MERRWKFNVSKTYVGSSTLLHEVVRAWQSPDLLTMKKEGINDNWKTNYWNSKTSLKFFEDSNTKVLKDINFELEEMGIYTLSRRIWFRKTNHPKHYRRFTDATTGDNMPDGVRHQWYPNQQARYMVLQSYALFPHTECVWKCCALSLLLVKLTRKKW